MDRRFLAAQLDCVGVCPNSMDAVSDRDFVAETVFAAALHLVHLSRWAEDLIIYSSGQYRFVQCSDAYATGAPLGPGLREWTEWTARVPLLSWSSALALVVGPTCWVLVSTPCSR